LFYFEPRASRERKLRKIEMRKSGEKMLMFYFERQASRERKQGK
jgi:hypothetical protein